MTDERGLHDALQRQADQLGHTHPFNLEDVQGKARGIRRRRAALSGLAAVTVLGISAPFALSLGNDATTPDRTTEVASTGVKDGLLTTQVDAESGAPGIAYADDAGVHLPDGGTVVPSDVGVWFGLLGDGFVVHDGEFLAVLSADGEVVEERPSTGSVAVSADHTIAVHATPDGGLEAVTADGRMTELPVPTDVQTPQPVAVEGSGSCDPEVNGGCVVYLSDAGEQPRGYALTSKGIINPLGQFRSLRDVSADGWVSGVVSLDDLKPGSCSEVWQDAFDDQARWATCEHTVDRFSPDSRYVVGLPAYFDGSGPASIALLDATDGTVLAEWTNNAESQAFVGTTAWDTDGTLLATVFERGSWSLMRFAADGGLSKVMDLEGGDDVSAPLLLAEGS